MNKDSKIYIAGHTGLVGSAITESLINNGYDNLIIRKIEELDLTDQAMVNDFFRSEQPEFVFIAAAMVGGIEANNTYRADFIYNNIMIQNNIIHAAWEYDTKKLLFLGSTCIYPKNAPQPLKEDYLLTSKLEYTNEPYAIAKIAGIKMCESFNIQYKTNFISVMPTNLYGTGDNYDLEKSHVLPALLRKFHLGRCLETGDWDQIGTDLNNYPIGDIDGSSDKKSILDTLEKHGVFLKVEKESKNSVVSVKVWGSGTPLREFMMSKDMAEACVYIMENVNIDDITALTDVTTDSENTSKPHFINIGTGEEISIRDLAQKIKYLTGFTGELVFDPSKPDGTMRKTTDISFLKSFGYKHKYSLDSGLEYTYRNYLDK